MLDLENGITVLSLFDGMSCGMIALQRAGIKVKAYYASEIDKPAMKVAKHNWPEIIHIGDVTKVFYAEGWLFTENGEFYVGKIDLTIGGSPCQGFSFAGKQLNFEDQRSKLFFEYVRLREETQCEYFMLENVVMKKEYQDIISLYLKVQPLFINSAIFTAQFRKRLYWLNIPTQPLPPDKCFVIRDILEDEVDEKYHLTEIQKSRIAPNAKEHKIFTKACSMGNTQPSGRGMNGFVWNADYKSPTLTTNKGEGIKIGIKQNNTSKKSNGKQPYFQDRIYDPDYKGVALTLESSRYQVGYEDQFRRLTPVECERLQSVNDYYTSSVPNSQRYVMLGNGWTVDVIAHLFEPLKYII